MFKRNPSELSKALYNKLHNPDNQTVGHVTITTSDFKLETPDYLDEKNPDLIAKVVDIWLQVDPVPNRVIMKLRPTSHADLMNVRCNTNLSNLSKLQIAVHLSSLQVM